MAKSLFGHSSLSLGAALAAAGLACASAAFAQQHRGPVAAPAAPRAAPAAPAAPRIAAPAPHIAAPAPRAAAPHFNAPPRVSAAPRFNPAPRTSAVPHFNAPRTAARPATPRVNNFAAHRSAPTTRSVPREASRARGPERNIGRAVSGNRVAGRNLSRQTLRNERNVSRSLAKGPSDLRSNRVDNLKGNRPGELKQNRVGALDTKGQNQRTNNRAMPNFRNDVRGREFVRQGFGRPLGERNRNDAERHRFFAERRNFRHGGFIGWFGPVFWPYAYDDVFDYAFWPGEYDDYGFWASAYDDVLGAALLAPDTGDLYGYADEGTSGRRGRRGRTASIERGGGIERGAGFDQAARETAAQVCETGETGLTQWPIAQIADAVRPTRDQQALLDELKTAAQKAADALRAACPRNVVATPLGRLDLIAERLDAMLQAIDVVQPALARFYDSLDDEQKARFNAISEQRDRTAERGRNASAQSQVCNGQGPGLTDEIVRRIEQDIRPTPGQRVSLDALKQSSAKAADELHNVCSVGTPLTPPGRLDAMAKRLQAMRHAVNTLRPALARFYTSLTDEQKARFNRLGA